MAVTSSRFPGVGLVVIGWKLKGVGLDVIGCKLVAVGPRVPLAWGEKPKNTIKGD